MRFFYLLLLLFHFLIGSDKAKQIILNENVNNLTKLKVNYNFSGTDIIISDSDSTQMLNASIEYFENSKKPILKFDKIGNTGIIDIQNEVLSSFNFNDESKKITNQLFLPGELLVKLNFDIQMSNIEFNLKDAIISDIALNFGIGNGKIKLNNYNKNSECKTLDIDLGMGALYIKNIGNLICNSMKFKAGLGSLKIEFSKEIIQNIDIDIIVGMGSATLIIPKSINATIIYKPNLFANTNFDGMVLIDNNTYRNEDYNSKNPMITFSTSISIGSLNLNWIN